MIEKDDWKPDGLPEMKHAFDDRQTEKSKRIIDKPLSLAQQEYERYREQKLAQLLGAKQQLGEEKSQNIATKWRLEALIEAREKSKPKSELTLKPKMGGMEQGNRLLDEARQRENRIQELVKTLAPLDGKAKNEFNLNADTFLHEKARGEQQQGMERD